jgi:hypothetical protein
MLKNFKPASFGYGFFWHDQKCKMTGYTGLATKDLNMGSESQAPNCLSEKGGG